MPVDPVEQARHDAWLAQVPQRFAKRAQLEAAFRGDPVARLVLQDQTQVLVDFNLDMNQPDAPDELDSRTVINQSLNWP